MKMRGLTSTASRRAVGLGKAAHSPRNFQFLGFPKAGGSSRVAFRCVGFTGTPLCVKQGQWIP